MKQKKNNEVLAQRKRSYKYKSKFEEVFGNNLEKQGIPFTYEKEKIKYVTSHTYSLDFCIQSGILLIETKGYFKASDRAKHLEIKKQNPELDIRFVFMHDNRIHKNSETRYSDWCKKHGFKYHVSAFGVLPKEWLDELKTTKGLKCVPSKTVRKKQRKV